MKKMFVYVALLFSSGAAHCSEIWIAYDDGTPKELAFEVKRDSKVKDLIDRFRTKTGFNHRYDIKFKLDDMVLKPNDSMNFVMNLAKPDHPLISATMKEKLPTMPTKIQ